MRDEDILKDILFGVFLVTVILLGVIYFMVPERAIFIRNQIAWWSELRKVILSFL